MPEVNERFERLERETRRLRGWVLVLAVALVATFALGATQGTPDELTLRRLAIVDADGKERIIASALPTGDAGIQYVDGNGKQRILAATFSDGRATTAHYDKDGKPRISTSTHTDGNASIEHYDRDGKQRILAATDEKGNALINLVDANAKSVWLKVSHK